MLISSKYGLNLPEETDVFSFEPFNENFEKIDGMLLPIESDILDNWYFRKYNDRNIILIYFQRFTSLFKTFTRIIPNENEHHYYNQCSDDISIPLPLILSSVQTAVAVMNAKETNADISAGVSCTIKEITSSSVTLNQRTMFPIQADYTGVNKKAELMMFIKGKY